MSGIAGIVNLDGAPIEAAVLRRMTGSLAFRGPDAQNTWIGSHAGFGHGLLKTTDEAEHERQPLSLDGKVWIVADARVDAQSDLIAGLKSKGQEVAPGVPDVELILRAYQVWGESCVEHLLGDFPLPFGTAPAGASFVRATIWRQALLLCAGRPDSRLQQYARQRADSPAVADRLNDLAIADFLLFGFNQEFGTTVYAEIQRLPPAHTSSWSPDGFALKRYWTLPIDEPIYYRRSHRLRRAVPGTVEHCGRRAVADQQTRRLYERRPGFDHAGRRSLFFVTQTE